MQARRVCNQADLFQVDQPAIQRVATDRAKLLPVLRSLLLQVVLGANPERPGKESDHE
jgi:hypothetical protein